MLSFARRKLFTGGALHPRWNARRRPTYDRLPHRFRRYSAERYSWAPGLTGVRCNSGPERNAARCSSVRCSAVCSGRYNLAMAGSAWRCPGFQSDSNPNCRRSDECSPCSPPDWNELSSARCARPAERKFGPPPVRRSDASRYFRHPDECWIPATPGSARNSVRRRRTARWFQTTALRTEPASMDALPPLCRPMPSAAARTERAVASPPADG